jgi:hypothetical protein
MASILGRMNPVYAGLYDHPPIYDYAVVPIDSHTSATRVTCLLACHPSCSLIYLMKETSLRIAKLLIMQFLSAPFCFRLLLTPKYSNPSPIRINKAKEGPKWQKKKVRKQINGKFNNTCSVDENKKIYNCKNILL